MRGASAASLALSQMFCSALNIDGMIDVTFTLTS